MELKLQSHLEIELTFAKATLSHFGTLLSTAQGKVKWLEGQEACWDFRLSSADIWNYIIFLNFYNGNKAF